VSTWGSPTDSPRRRVAHQATERYLGHMPATGGLKLALQAATREDRRLRFAQVKLRPAGIEDALSLVTDARGRMRYRLPDGKYQLSLPGGPCVRFVLRDRLLDHGPPPAGVAAVTPGSAFRAGSGAHRAGPGASRWRAEADPLARRADV
jgi:hypothetical protein